MNEATPKLRTPRLEQPSSLKQTRELATIERDKIIRPRRTQVLISSTGVEPEPDEKNVTEKLVTNEIRNVVVNSNL